MENILLSFYRVLCQ